MRGDPEVNLLVRRGEGAWASPAVSAYGNEAQLRDLLALQPSLLPGLGPGATAVTELTIPGAGSVDVAAVDGEGAVCLVECKLASNPEIRRQVVGQVLAYASGLWKVSLEEFEATWARRSGRSLAATVLGDDHDDARGQVLRDGVGTALSDGRFVLVLAVDVITAELRRIVEYLNAHTVDEVSVLALEIRYAMDGDTEMIIPRVFGAELAESPTRVRPTRRWTEEDVIRGFAEAGDGCRQVAQRLIDHYRDRVALLYFGVGRRPSLTFVFETQAGRTQPLSLWATDPPSFSPNFEYTSLFPADVRRRFVDAVAVIDGTRIDADAVAQAGFAKRPGIPVPGVLDQPGAVEGLIAALDGLLDSARIS
ncbi:MAG: hypothetical protein AB7V62_06555 [Thermoleophilia bacterium]